MEELLGGLGGEVGVTQLSVETKALTVCHTGNPQLPPHSASIPPPPHLPLPPLKNILIIWGAEWLLGPLFYMKTSLPCFHRPASPLVCLWQQQRYDGPLKAFSTGKAQHHTTPKYLRSVGFPLQSPG